MLLVCESLTGKSGEMLCDVRQQFLHNIAITLQDRHIFIRRAFFHVLLSAQCNQSFQ